MSFRSKIDAGGYGSFSSDLAHKINIEDIGSPLEKINSLRGVRYLHEDEKHHKMGMITHEVEKIIPEAVITNHSGLKSVSFHSLTGLLIEGLKAQQRIIAEHALQLQIQQEQIRELYEFIEKKKELL